MTDAAADRRPLSAARIPTRIAWAVATVVCALVVAVVDARMREMQSALLLYFLAAFWLTFARRVPTWLVFGALASAPFLLHVAAARGAASWSAAATLGAVALGTIGGAVAGRAFDPLDPGGPAGAPQALGGAVSARALLALALSVFAALGLVPVWSSIRLGGLALGIVPVTPIGASLVAVRWAQVLTLVGWVMLTPVLLRLRATLRGPGASIEHGISLREIAWHVLLVTGLLAAHALALALLAEAAAARWTLVFLGPTPGLMTVWASLTAAYAPFDLLTYVALLGLAHLTDRARQAREARQRAAALETAAVTARLAALRARLDPHFLYNALNAAVTLARRGRGDDTSHVLEELTALLRYVLDDTRTRVPLSDELEFVQRYLGITRLRFGSRCAFAIDVDAAAREATVPMLVLQPLVENAVEHGVANADTAVTVRVAARRAGDRLVLTVEDDGPGLDASQRRGSGVGLGATRERLAMLYGDDAGVVLRARTPRGAVTEVTLPFAGRDSA